ncbi:MAG: hypothetical protein ACI88A_003310 [Paraglaciecola sp.]|jgi:hypothetical protein
MPNTQRPLFSRFPGNVVAKPPCRMLNANMCGFFVKGETELIQQYLDSTLNSVPSENVRYECLSPYTLLTFTDIEKISSLATGFADQGWMQETDIIIWLPVAKKVNNKIDHIYWYPAFICVNNIYALINGINTWGYNKYLCDYVMPERGAEPDFLSISVDAFQPFSGQTEMVKHLLMEVKQVSKGDESELTEFVDLVKQAFDLLSAEKSFFNFDYNVLKQMMQGFTHPQMDQILFKQFPDGEGENAVYQAVMHSPSIIKKVHSAKLYTHQYDVTLHQVDTFRLDQAFGIKLGTQRALLPFSVLMDFDQQAAFPLAESS